MQNVRSSASGLFKESADCNVLLWTVIGFHRYDRRQRRKNITCSFCKYFCNCIATLKLIKAIFRSTTGRTTNLRALRTPSHIMRTQVERILLHTTKTSFLRGSFLLIPREKFLARCLALQSWPVHFTDKVQSTKHTIPYSSTLMAHTTRFETDRNELKK